MINTDNCDTYISVRELKKRFTIYVGYKPDFGVFYVVRWLYAIVVDGAEWIKVLSFVITFALTPLALSIDFAALLSVGVLYVAYKIVVTVIDLIIKCFSTLFSTIVSNYLGTLLKLVAIAMFAMSIYLKFEDIWYGVNWLLSEGKIFIYSVISGS